MRPVPQPPPRQGDLGDGGAVMGVDHRALTRGDGAVAGRQVGAEREQQDVAGLRVAQRDRNEVV